MTFEVQRLVQFLETSGGSLRSTIEEEREKASEQLDFERAAALHKKSGKLDEVLRGQPELTRRIQDLDAVILQRAAEDQTIGVFRVSGGRLAEPFFLRFAEICQPAAPPKHIFSRAIRSKLRTTRGRSRRAPVAGGALVFTAIRAKAKFSSAKKTGPIVGFSRACSRLLAPKTADADSNPAPGPAPSPEGAS